ncbi:hydroxymethylglutaryl-CoA lyase [Bhargavaea beijingensis]|uniref:Hydroxymethylglutaryl-CoA lyase n=1 Tax=Bhargavaea beijingensis TaxID=426756 RepID=A0A1G7ARM9_9BACL|nr:hydroxymethylglutaryl-CoA lyase [Bhargavaea beijingensis]MCW1928245.1 hydroxymethylglutaryl-CoA lyase [Bhargavaea beijingensis]RSK37853.1 hydroxymethylglutaryl-CoA lyase [Bhargavaea beijingensis]SDE17382.1 hydroxymethylglutaryl-CoA lyase [Bhargavaea beijingensis]
MLSLPKKVSIIEVGPRDGLQNEKNQVPTDVKLHFIRALQDAGVGEMELTSFVSPKWVPQMGDAADIMAGAKRIGRQFVLAPNERGIANARAAGADSIAVFVGVTDAFNKKNINRTTDESMEQLTPLIQKMKEDGLFVRACISTAFHCPFEGPVDPERTVNLCKRFARLGVDELSVADTIGMATPQESELLFSRLKEELPDILMTAHFHDTRKMALANIFASLQAGVDRFDASAGGLGGCPFAPGATGNVATEDVVNMLERMDIDTGISVEGICRAVDVVASHVSRPISTGMYTLYKNAHRIG